MRHVWIFNHYAHLPTDVGGLTRHYALARHLPRHGWRATVIAASTLHPSGRQRADQREPFRLEEVDGVPFLWLKTPEYRGNGGDRIANMLTYAWRAGISRAALGVLEPPDLVIGSTLHPAGALAAGRVARRLGVPFIFEVRDLWPLALIQMGRMREGSLAARALRAIEARLHREAAATVTLWPRMSAYLDSIGATTPVVNVPNGIDLDQLPVPTPVPDRNRFDVMYLGAHGGANALDNALRAMKLVEDNPSGRNVRLRLIGDGPLKTELRELATSLGLGNVSFENPVPKRKVPEIAAEADAFLLSLIDAPMFQYGMSPNKLFDYMAAERPTIVCATDLANPVALARSGPSVPPGDPERLAEAIITLARMPRADRAEMATRGRSYVIDNHSFDRLSGMLAQAMNEAMEGRVGQSVAR